MGIGGVASIVEAALRDTICNSTSITENLVSVGSCIVMT